MTVRMVVLATWLPRRNATDTNKPIKGCFKYYEEWWELTDDLRQTQRSEVDSSSLSSEAKSWFVWGWILKIMAYYDIGKE
jgi:hypothetical protein